MSETAALPCRCSSAPATTMVMTASVLAPRVSTVTTAHQFSTGNWWRTTFSTMPAKGAGLGLQAAEGLHGDHVGQRILRHAGKFRMGGFGAALAGLGAADGRGW